MLTRITEYCSQNSLFSKGERVIIGLSGGPDSVFLLNFLREIQREMELGLFAVHVNHGIRESAARDQAFCEKLCEGLGIPLRVFSFDVPRIAGSRGESEEEAGRNVRREAFALAKKEFKADKIALAHHLNDRAETVLLNLIRGSHVKGLRGILPINGEYVRPLLYITREEILSELKAEGIDFCIDETNESRKYTRNRLRNEIFPVLERDFNPNAAAHIAAAADSVSRLFEYVERLAGEAFFGCAGAIPEGLSLDIPKLLEMEDVIREEVLYRALGEVAGSLKDLEAVHVRKLTELACGRTGRRLDLPYNVTASKEYDRLLLARKSEKKAFCGMEGRFEYELVEVRDEAHRESLKAKNEYTKCFDYDIIKGDLCVRTRAPGDYMIVDDLGHRRKLKDYFIDEKIPRDEREAIPLLAKGSNILWAVGYRTGCGCLINSDTKRVLKISFKEGKTNHEREY